MHFTSKFKTHAFAKKFVAVAFYYAIVALSPAQAADQPNILWITCEDTSPNFGCYGDDYAITPNIDALAARGLRCTNANSNAPVCAAARTTIITGLYPPSTGAEHMRSFVDFPQRFPLFPHFLREVGYYCTNNNKEDYNIEKPEGTWDESSKKATWKDRRAGQPFFAVFNFIISHESQIRNEIDPANRIHDPAKVRLPSYHPDAPEVRRDWAQYYDRVTMMDAMAGEQLDQIQKAGLADDTIIFFFSDHGSGMPRSKRSACKSGLNVPFIVYFPPKWQHLAPTGYRADGTSDRLISFVDLAPTMLSLAGIKPPEWMQGTAFCGKYAQPEADFSFGFRGRMDERYDLVRSARDKRYMYVRNFMPHRPHGQHNAYMFQTPTTKVWYQLFKEGKLNAVQSQFWVEPKSAEELYDLQNDPDEVKNLAGSPDHAAELKKLRTALDDWEHRIKDVDILSEWEMHERSKGSTPYDMGHDSKQYDFDAIYAAAKTATSLRKDDLPAIVEMLSSKDSGIRYWGATGLLTQGKAGVAAGHEALVKALADDSPIVQVTAAEALGRFGSDEDNAAALKVLLHHVRPEADAYLAAAAWNSLDFLDERAASAKQAIRDTPPLPIDQPRRFAGPGQRLKQQTLSDLK